MQEQTIKPKDGDSYLIESYDGELVLTIDIKKPLKNLTLVFPTNPPRASKIRLHTNQDIKNIHAVGSFNEPFTTLAAGNIGFVACPVGHEYLVTGINNVPAPKRRWLDWLFFWKKQ